MCIVDYWNLEKSKFRSSPFITISFHLYSNIFPSCGSVACDVKVCHYLTEWPDCVICNMWIRSTQCVCVCDGTLTSTLSIPSCSLQFNFWFPISGVVHIPNAALNFWYSPSLYQRNPTQKHPEHTNAPWNSCLTRMKCVLYLALFHI